MIAEIRYNVWVFFARIRTKKRIKAIKRDIERASWYLSVEKIDDVELIGHYNKLKVELYMNQVTLDRLEYV
jgi:hypothetical protein